MPAAVFETVRPARDRFLVVRGHESSDDRVIAAEATYAVVIDENGWPALERTPPAA